MNRAVWKAVFELGDADLSCGSPHSDESLEPALWLACLSTAFDFSLPYGEMTIITGTLVLLATVLTMAYGFGCGWISHAWGPVGNVTTYLGPWTAQAIDLEGATYDDSTKTATIYYSGYCYLYSSLDWGSTFEDNLDSYFKTARAFSMMAIVLAILLFFFSMLACCVEFPAGTRFFRFGAFTCIFTMFCTYMTLVRVTQIEAMHDGPLALNTVIPLPIFFVTVIRDRLLRNLNSARVARSDGVLGSALRLGLSGFLRPVQCGSCLTRLSPKVKGCCHLLLPLPNRQMFRRKLKERKEKETSDLRGRCCT
jgi:hypothetical protein